MNFQIKKQKGGYTLIETMIAISLFVVVVMMGMGVLLNANLLHQKSRDMRSIMDNLSFVMEDISKNLRTGSDYRCIEGEDDLFSHDPKDCVGGGGISFKESISGDWWTYYITLNPNDLDKRVIMKRVESTTDGINEVQITPSEIDIDEESFFMVEGSSASDEEQPFATIRLKGSISYKRGRVETPFLLQTSVSQRLIDIGGE